MEPQFRYRAFISYSHADEAWAKWLHPAIETCRVPKRLAGNVTEAGREHRVVRPIAAWYARSEAERQRVRRW